MICQIYNNVQSEAIRAMIYNKTVEAQKYPIGPERNKYAQKMLGITYCDGQFHIRTQGAWGVDVALGKCPQWTGQAMVVQAQEQAPPEHKLFTWENYIDHSGDGAKIKEWAAGSGRILILRSAAGRGKTHLARALHYQLLDDGKTAEYIESVKLKKYLLDMSPINRDRLEDHYTGKRKIQRYKKADVLIIDDLGEDSIDGVAATFVSGLKELLDDKAGRLIITTNLITVDREEKGYIGMYGGRVASRILGGAEIISLKGDDYRRKQ